MTRVKAAFTLKALATAEQVEEEAYAAARRMNILVESLQAGVADDWCVLSARLAPVSHAEAEAWVLVITMALGGSAKPGQAAVFRLDVEGASGRIATEGVMN